MGIKAAWKALWGIEEKAFTPTAGYQLINGQLVSIDDRASNYISEGYGANEIIFSIVNQAAEKEKAAPWGVYKIKDESSLKSYRKEMLKSTSRDFDFKKALDFRTKALETYTGDGKLTELLQWANEEETFQDIVAGSGAYKRLSGNRYIWANLLEGGANDGKPQELHLMPSDLTQPLVQRSWPPRKVGYQMTYEQILQFSLEAVLHDKTWNPSRGVPGDTLVGMSPIKAALTILTRNKANKLSSTKAFQNQGPPAIIYVDDARLSGTDAVAQAGAIKQKLFEEWGGPANTKKMAVSGYKTGATLLGISPVELESLKLEQWDVILFCMVLNFPPLLVMAEHATLDNYKMATRELVTKTCLPSLVDLRGALNRKIEKHWGYAGKGLYIDFDATVYPELQVERKEIAEWTSKVPLTIRQTYEALQLEIPKDYVNSELIDKIFMPNGKTLLDDLDPSNLDSVMNGVDDGTS